MAAVIKPEHRLAESSEDISTNPTDNRSFTDVATAHLSRRKVLQGSLAVAATGFFAPTPGHAHGRGTSLAPGQNKGPLLDFQPLTIENATAARGQTITISPDYEYHVLIPWGTPIDPSSGIAPYDGDPINRPTSAEQEQMIGIGHDGMWFFPSNLPRVLETEARRGRELPADARRRVLDSRSGMLCVNHEFGTNFHVLGKDVPADLEEVRRSQAAHGVSVVAIAENWRGSWSVITSNNSRRITGNTEVEFSGPAAGSALLNNNAGNVPRGTLNNCGSGPTPWGTYLTCEENFNGYFGTEQAGIGGFDPLQDTAYARYGFSSGGFGYFWHRFDPRFDLANPDYANESNRFGWCVEIDPFDSTRKPVKRTALGRFKHEAAAIKELDDGRIAVYMGDDQRGDYCYKYESRAPWRYYIAAGMSPLDDGKLYVARFDEGSDENDGRGTGEWIELTYQNPDIQAAGLDSQDKVLTYARLAADAVGATPMDRPEWSTIGTNGQVYWTLTNNDRKDSGQGALSEANPIFENADGYIIETQDTSTTGFEWSLFLLARNTRSPDDPRTALDANDFRFADYQQPADGGANVFTDPDAAYADPFGRLFIGTDGGQPDGLQDQLVVFDTNTGEYRRLLMGVNSDEITGLAPTPDFATLFTNTQHPGDGSPLSTNFPAEPDGLTIPRDATIVIRRKDGGIVGS
jgi:secreted PhoX family phosphatase